MAGHGEGAKPADENKPDWAKNNFWGKLWYFIWYDDSALSWLVNVLLAFLIIKFIFYPLIGLILHTSFPVVAVVSSSMEHGARFDDWWNQNEDQYLERNITKIEFEEFPFKNGFNKGDLMILVGKQPAEIDVGDVIVFQSMKPYPIIHRVVDVQHTNIYIYQTKGDNNKDQIRDPELDETRVLDKTLLGKAVIRIPWIGYVKIWFVEILGMVGINVA